MIFDRLRKPTISDEEFHRILLERIKSGQATEVMAVDYSFGEPGKTLKERWAEAESNPHARPGTAALVGAKCIALVSNRVQEVVNTDAEPSPREVRAIGRLVVEVALLDKELEAVEQEAGGGEAGQAAAQAFGALEMAERLEPQVVAWAQELDPNAEVDIGEDFLTVQTVAPAGRQLFDRLIREVS